MQVETSGGRHYCKRLFLFLAPKLRHFTPLILPFVAKTCFAAYLVFTLPYIESHTGFLDGMAIATYIAHSRAIAGDQPLRPAFLACHAGGPAWAAQRHRHMAVCPNGLPTPT